MSTNLNTLNPYLTAYWPLEESSGIRDDVINSISLSPQDGSISRSEGKNGYAINFDSNAYLQTPHNNFLGRTIDTRGFMLSCWVLFDNVGNTNILEKDPYFKIQTGSIDEEGLWNATISGVTFDGSSWGPAVARKWYHVFMGASKGKGIFAIQSSSGRSYVTNSSMGSLTTSASPLYVGRKFIGRLDDLAFWYAQDVSSIDDFLSIQESLYENGSGRFYNTLKNLWQLPTNVNGITSFPYVEVTPNTNRTPSLARIRTYYYPNGKKVLGNDGSDRKATVNGIDSTSLSFGNLSPGQKSETLILKLVAPDAIILRNIRIGLIDAGGLNFSNIKIETLEYKDLSFTPDVALTGLSDGKDSDYNIDVDSDGRNESVYVYVNVNVPRNYSMNNGVLRFKWFFDWS